MTEKISVSQVRVHRRVSAGMARSENWKQLLRFGAVGATGFAINIGVYTLLVHGGGVNYLVAAGVAYLVAVMNNFVINRLWTFRDADGHAGFQAARFLVVSLGAQGVSLEILHVMVADAGAAKTVGQAVAVAAATPLNFVGNKLWSFSR